MIQNEHVAALERGFRTDDLVAVDLPSDHRLEPASAFRAAVEHAPGVVAAAWSDDVPGRADGAVSSVANEHGGATVRVMTVEPGFFAVYGVRPLAGQARYDAPPPAARNAIWATLPASATEAERWEALKPHDRPAVVDLAAARALGFADPSAAIGTLLHGGGDFMQVGAQSWRIVAVVPTLRLASAREKQQPELFELTGAPTSTLTLRGPDAAALRTAVETTWPRFFPNDIPDVERVDVQLAAALANDRRVARFAFGATMLALMLGGFGVYALAAHAVRRSAREIVVRKLYGAGRARIAGLLLREFAPLLGVAALAGLPLAAWMTRAWLANFVERTSLAYWALPIALGALVALTTLAAARHAIVAMNIRPSAALRD
jgi:putative ABC transport system permease protein